MYYYNMAIPGWNKVLARSRCERVLRFISH